MLIYIIENKNLFLNLVSLGSKMLSYENSQNYIPASNTPPILFAYHQQLQSGKGR